MDKVVPEADSGTFCAIICLWLHEPGKLFIMGWKQTDEKQIREIYRYDKSDRKRYGRDSSRR